MRAPRLVLSLLILLAAPSAVFAASPTSGSLSAAGQTLSYSAGPLAVSNSSVASSPAAPVCSATQPCDDYALTVNVAADYATTHPRDVVKVVARFPLNQNVYYLYVLDGTGKILYYATTGNDPIALALPAKAGSYTVRIVPQQAGGDTLSVTVSLLADQTAAATGIPPRFTQYQPTDGSGDNTAGEMSIGYNPKTGRAITLGYTKTLRTTFPERLTPALPEVCDAEWKDVSYNLTQQNTNDPILFTDQATGRTFVSQLQAGTPGQSVFAYTDNDGDSWTLSPSTADGGIDHQTVGTGPYSATGTAKPSGSYPNAVYYCSQSVAVAFCIRSDNGGSTYGAPAPIKTAAGCDGFLGSIHGHVRVAADGTAYVPDRNCGGVQTLLVSEDSGATWAARRAPATTSGEGDPSIGLASDGTGYLCYLDGDSRAHVTVTHDRGRTFTDDHDVAYAAGVQHSVFVTATAGDPNRAACAFFGTTTRGNYQATDFTGIWFAYIAMTYDGGKTWHTVQTTPSDPVQGKAGICLAGTTCIQNRNLLDFNEITHDETGRVLFGYDDGCLGACITTGNPNTISLPGFGLVPDLVINTDARSSILRQTGGRTLFAAFDSTEPVAPKAACLFGTRDKYVSHLNWRTPDHGGASITRYRIYRGTSATVQNLLIGKTPDARVLYNDTQNDPATKYWYKITAVNAKGEGLFSNIVPLDPSTVVPANTEPTPSLSVTPQSGSAPLDVSFTVGGSDPDSSDTLASYTLDFGDGQTASNQSFGGAGSVTLSHRYASEGSYLARLTVTDSRGLASSNAAEQIINATAAAPTAFNFIERVNVPVKTFVTSESVTVSGYNGSLPISTSSGGQYSINGAPFTTAAGQIAASDKLVVRHVSAATENTATESTVMVGGYSTIFRSVTTSLDRVPDAFSFGSVSGQLPGMVVESAAITLTGFNTNVPIVAGPGTEYRVGSGSWTQANGTLTPVAGGTTASQTLQVRSATNPEHLGYTKTYLKVGGVTGYFVTRTK